MAMAFITC